MQGPVCNIYLNYCTVRTAWDFGAKIDLQIGTTYLSSFSLELDFLSLHLANRLLRV